VIFFLVSRILLLARNLAYLVTKFGTI
jgi:hypothetical protein